VPERNPHLQASAKALRKRMTPADRLLWSNIRELKSQGTRFRRQVVIGPCIVDFACHTSRVVVEVDGSGHGFDPQIAKDAIRDEWLRGEGYEVVRIWNRDLMADPDGVLTALWAIISSRLQG